MDQLKREFLELLDKDVEFRYAVAGYLGLSELLKRLDALSEEQVRLREEQSRIWGELKSLREEQVKLREEQGRIWGELKSLREEQVRLREDFNRMFNVFDTRLSRVERTLEKLTVDIEDEARSILRHRLKQDLGLDVELGSLSLPEMELNIYGASGDFCIVGEATVRGGVKTLNDLLRKIELLKSKYPDKLRAKLIPVVYASLPLPELVEEARNKDVWILKATQDYHKPRILGG